MNFDWKSIVGSVAPVLGTALGGPLAGTAVRELTEKWLGDDSAGEADLAEAVRRATPEELAKLRKIDHDFEVRMREMGLDVERLAVDDRKSARGLFAINIWPQIVLSTVFALGYFLLLWWFVAGGAAVNESLRAPFNIVLGVLTAAMSQIMSFWFGSSLGSKEKTSQLRRPANEGPR